MNEFDVRLLDVMGNDRTIAEAAWASGDACMNRTDEEVARVVRFLARSSPQHWTPFATGAHAKFRLTMPSFVWDQWRRHRIGISRVEADDAQDIADVLWEQDESERVYNSESRRYVDGPLRFMATDEGFWRERRKGKHSGSSETPLEAGLAKDQEKQRQEMLTAFEAYYKYSLARGVSPEQARMDLPRSFVSTHIETGSLYAYARICLHRIHPEAEGPIRPFAQKVSDILAERFPVAWPALMGKK